jgi:CRP/FNR family transcriptional regulator, cyclic AMP receptor protein
VSKITDSDAHANHMRSQELNVHNKCRDCDSKRKHYFCDLPDDELAELDTIKVTKVYPKGTMLFLQGQPSDGVYMVCQGKVKISTCSMEGKVIILDVAGPGEMLGLASTLNQTEHETSAEVLELCQVNYIGSHDLMKFVRTNPNACFSMARQLSRSYQTAHHQICSIVLSESVVDKLARLFLEWVKKGSVPSTYESGPVHMRNFYTHEQMAEMIGSSRETVTRALRHFRERELVTLKGSELIIHDLSRLEASVGQTRSYRAGV